MNAHSLIPGPIEIDPRPCGLCGLTIDQHECIDEGDGPEFFCMPDDHIVMRWEMSDPRDAWRHTGEAPPPAHVRNGPLQAARPQSARPYRPAQSTIEEFFSVAGLEDPRRLAAWLLDHPLDAPHLHKIWKQKCTALR